MRKMKTAKIKSNGKPPGVSVEWEDPSLMYRVYKDVEGEWRWRLKARNNRTVADSGEGYHNRGDCLAAIGLVKSSAEAPVRK